MAFLSGCSTTPAFHSLLKHAYFACSKRFLSSEKTSRSAKWLQADGNFMLDSPRPLTFEECSQTADMPWWRSKSNYPMNAMSKSASEQEYQRSASSCDALRVTPNPGLTCNSTDGAATRQARLTASIILRESLTFAVSCGCKIRQP